MAYTDEEFTAIMDEYGDMVLRICYVRLKNMFDAQDAFQEVFISLYNAKNKPDNSYLKPWLIKSACNKSISFLRRKKPVQSLSGNEAAEHGGFDDTVLNAVMGLEKNQRVAVYLFYYENLKTGEIAQIMKLSEGNVRVILHRARERLKNELRGDFFE